jgi:hypothetical protein
MLKEKTLALLAKHRIDPERIVVFVGNEAENLSYEKTLIPGTYGKIVVGEVGRKEIDNFITRYFKKGTHIFSIDDDISEVVKLSEGPRAGPMRGLHSFICRAFELAKKNKLRLWGIYPSNNAFFMRNGPPTTNLKFIVGSFYGIINPGIEELRLTFDDKDDYQRSIIMYLLDGGMLRFTDVAVKTRNYHNEGGMQVQRTPDRVSRTVASLMCTYPNFVERNARRRSGFAELKLKDTRPKDQRSFGREELLRQTHKKCPRVATSKREQPRGLRIF